jgi:hypothetical protein
VDLLLALPVFVGPGIFEGLVGLAGFEDIGVILLEFGRWE